MPLSMYRRDISRPRRCTEKFADYSLPKRHVFKTEPVHQKSDDVGANFHQNYGSGAGVRIEQDSHAIAAGCSRELFVKART